MLIFSFSWKRTRLSGAFQGWRDSPTRADVQRWEGSLRGQLAQGAPTGSQAAPGQKGPEQGVTAQWEQEAGVPEAAQTRALQGSRPWEHRIAQERQGPGDWESFG